MRFYVLCSMFYVQEEKEMTKNKPLLSNVKIAVSYKL